MTSIRINGIGLAAFCLLFFVSFASWTRRAPAIMRWLYGMAGIGFVLGSVASYTLGQTWVPAPTRYVLFVVAYAIVAAPIVVLGRGYPFLIMDLIRIVRRRFGDRSVQATVCANCGYDLRGATGEQRCPECGRHGAGGDTMKAPMREALKGPHIFLGVAALILAICVTLIGVLWFNANAYQLLLIAIDHRDVEAVRLWMARGVDLNRSYDDGSGKTMTPILKAAIAGDAEIVDLLLRAGADANFREGTSGWTPLIAAAHLHADPDTLELLIGAGADVSPAAATGATALHGAARHGSARSTHLLLEAGAPVEASDTSGMTPLMWARSADTPAAAEALIDAGADVHARDNRGKTPLMHAAQRPKAGSLVELLVRAGADVDARDDGGRTALTYAAELCCVEAADALISSGADVDARDSNGKTPLMHIGIPMVNSRGERGDPRRFVELLLEAGADVGATDNQQRTVLWHARNYDTWTEAVDRLVRAVADER